jgi:hypothetical protein
MTANTLISGKYKTVTHWPHYAPGMEAGSWPCARPRGLVATTADSPVPPPTHVHLHHATGAAGAKMPFVLLQNKSRAGYY